MYNKGTHVTVSAGGRVPGQYFQGTPRYRFLMTVQGLTVLKYTVLFERETDSHFLTVPILAVYGTANYDGFFCTVLKMTVRTFKTGNGFSFFDGTFCTVLKNDGIAYTRYRTYDTCDQVKFAAEEVLVLPKRNQLNQKSYNKKKKLLEVMKKKRRHQ